MKPKLLTPLLLNILANHSVHAYHKIVATPSYWGFGGFYVGLNYIPGSGDGGRIVKRDIDAFMAGSVQGSANAVESFYEVEVSQMRKVIARRLAESKFSAPHFYLTMDIDMDNAMTARKAINDQGMKVSFNDMVVKACAMALRKHPAVNSSWMSDFIRTYQHIHIGSAVAVDQGLIVPVFKFADQKSLSQIAGEGTGLYEKARTGKLQPQEFSGNTFTISNLGMMDIEEFTAIINPPDSCILAVGRIKEVVVKKADGQFGTTNVMKVTLSCDHRSVDGAVGASFLQTLKKFIENPVTMLV
jgi:pyruvate dehydrogenase E2 component (dihydrolipoamide acetyltransferase)